MSNLAIENQSLHDEDDDNGASEPCIKTEPNGIDENELCGFNVVCCGKESKTTCGICQPFATVKWAIFLFCIGNMLYQTVINGLLSVNISTIEKRFEFRSTESGMIAGSVDFAFAITMLLVLLLREDIHKPHLMACGLVVSGAGMLLLGVPHFLAPPYTFVDAEIFNYCGNMTEPDCGQSMLRHYRFWFIVAIALVGCGGAPLFAFAITFIDENTDKGNSAFYNAIFMAMGGLGPAIGFVAGGFALELYTDIGKSFEDITIDSSSYVWVGAWWIGFQICGVLAIMNAVPIFLLPKHLPNTSQHRKNRNDEAQKGHSKNDDSESKSVPVRAFSEVMALLKNKPYLFTTLALTVNCAFIYGFNTFGAKYIESVFGLTPFQASLLYGIAAIFASFGAQMTGGIIIKKMKLEVLGIIKFVLIIGVISALCSIGFFLHCPDTDFVGGSVPYSNTTFTMSPYSSCNMDCDCSTDRYEPVCGEDDSIYFSPCFAGCNVQINGTAFTNCSCISNSTAYSNPILSIDTCNRKSCSMIYPFVAIIFICFFTSILTLSPAVQVTLRCVPFNKRVIALSLQSAVSRLLGIIPGRVIVGMVLDIACVSWGTECGEKGSCKAYDREAISRNNTILLLSQTAACAFFYILVWWTYKPVGEENDEKQQNEALVEKSDNEDNTLSQSMEKQGNE